MNDALGFFLAIGLVVLFGLVGMFVLASQVNNEQDTVLKTLCEKEGYVYYDVAIGNNECYEELPSGKRIEYSYTKIGGKYQLVKVNYE